MAQPSPQLLHRLLRDVSRSFYLTLRVLPGPVRPQIGLAYLLARASDTIADTDAVSKEQRLEVLENFRQRVALPDRPPIQLDRIAGFQTSPAERTLLQRLEQAIAILGQFASADQERIRTVLETIISGQALDVSRFAEASAQHIAALPDEAALEDYTYRVAGCVGEFWTRMCRAHLFPRVALDDALLLSNGVRFGKGLQLVNILRDLPVDLRSGRCYLPALSLRERELEPSNLLDPSCEVRFRPLYRGYLQSAQAHLEAGWAYTNQLPYRQVRVRLACAWPILIGLQTLDKLRKSNVLDPTQRVKISRQDVRQILFRSLAFYPWPQRWRALVDVGTSAQNTLPRETTLAK